MVQQIAIEQDTLKYCWAHSDEAFVFAIEHDERFVCSVHNRDELFHT